MAARTCNPCTQEARKHQDSKFKASQGYRATKSLSPAPTKKLHRNDYSLHQTHTKERSCLILISLNYYLYGIITMCFTIKIEKLNTIIC